MNQIKHKSILALFLAFMVLLALGVSIAGASGKQASPQRPLAAATSTPSQSDAFYFCANEGGSCTIPDSFNPASARYGANNQYIYKQGFGYVNCTVAAFGSDPIYGTPKTCAFIGMPVDGMLGSTADPNGYKYTGFTACGTENTYCSFSGTKLVRYGIGAKQNYKVATGGIACTYTALGGDPAQGFYKQCLYANPVTPNDPSSGWLSCASENGNCWTDFGDTVAYGANGAYYYKVSPGGMIGCNNTTFGDPIRNVTKSCYRTAEWDPAGWTRCGGEGDTCYFLGNRTVAYGAKGYYTYQNATGSIHCGVDAFGSDPIWGTLKSCYYKTPNGTYPTKQ
ncbi:MAG: hypothetical protein WA821_05475 [Anaerolineales bacterium]